MGINYINFYNNLHDNKKKLGLIIQFQPKYIYTKCLLRYLQGIFNCWTNNKIEPCKEPAKNCLEYNYRFHHQGGNLNYNYNFGYQSNPEITCDFKHLNSLANEIADLKRSTNKTDKQLLEALTYLKEISDKTNKNQYISYNEISKLFQKLEINIDKVLETLNKNINQEFNKLVDQNQKDLQEIKEMINKNNLYKQDLEEIKKRLKAIEEKL